MALSHRPHCGIVALLFFSYLQFLLHLFFAGFLLTSSLFGYYSFVAWQMGNEAFLSGKCRWFYPWYPIGLKNFPLDICIFARDVNSFRPKKTRSSLSSEVVKSPITPRRGTRAPDPTDHQRFATTGAHLPVYTSKRQSCKRCSKVNDVHRSRWICDIWQAALFLSDARNCFTQYHTTPLQLPSTSGTNPWSTYTT